MRLLFGSDFHGNINAYHRYAELLEYADFGILGGDLNTGFTPDEFEEIKKEYNIEDDDLLEELHSENDFLPINPNLKLKEAFKQKEKEYKSILRVSKKKIYYIMGNDDGIVGGEWDEDELFKSINMKRINFGDFNIVGYQYTLPFIGGFFEKKEEEQLKDMQIISEFIDESTIFISHGPAYGENDLLYNNFDGSRVRIGSKALAKLLNDKKPRYHLYGHYHQKYGIRKNSINGSYPISKKFILIDYESKKTKWLK